MNFPDFAGQDLPGGPTIPSGSVWESRKNFSHYLVQWFDRDKWMVLAWYHINGTGGAAFLPCGNLGQPKGLGRCLFTQYEVEQFLKERDCRRVDARFEPVKARRDSDLPDPGSHCPDEACPGVIEDDGECSHCGLDYTERDELDS